MKSRLLKILLVGLLVFCIFTLAVRADDDDDHSLRKRSSDDNNNDNEVAHKRSHDDDDDDDGKKRKKHDKDDDDDDDHHKKKKKDDDDDDHHKKKKKKDDDDDDDDDKKKMTAAKGTDTTGADAEGLPFFNAFFASFSMILVSEIGDKTFFIAAVMAMRQSRLEVFFSAIAALILMTVLSAGLGYTLPTLISRHYTHILSIVLFFFFGFKLLRDAMLMPVQEGKNEELQEVEEELEKTELENDDASANAIELEEGTGGTVANIAAKKAKPWWSNLISRVFMQVFTMTFLAEWGDRSQIATIALAASKDLAGVTLGGILGHALCTGGAVIGGKMIASRISERTVAIVGGLLFIAFAIHGLATGQ